MSLSIGKAKYFFATIVVCQVLWMRKMLTDLWQKEKGATTIYCDNNSTIVLSKNSVFHKRRKDIDTKYHFILELINKLVYNTARNRSSLQTSSQSH